MPFFSISFQSLISKFHGRGTSSGLCTQMLLQVEPPSDSGLGHGKRAAMILFSLRRATHDGHEFTGRLEFRAPLEFPQPNLTDVMQKPALRKDRVADGPHHHPVPGSPSLCRGIHSSILGIVPSRNRDFLLLGSCDSIVMQRGLLEVE
jgi:hypothetical protein